LEYWLSWMRSGIFPSLWVPPLMLAGFLLPFLGRFKEHLPLVQRVRPKLLLDVVAASLVWFGLAHLLLFRLQLPSRYTQHSFRVVWAIAAAIGLAALFDGFSRWLNQASPQNRLKALGLTLAAAIGLIAISPTPAKSYPYLVYVPGRTPALYEFFQQQPKDIMIASLTQEANNLPTFAQRSILTGREYALPYHRGYYQKLRQRTVDLIAAQYGDLAKLQAFIQQYGVDFFVVEQESFKPYYVADDFWLRQYEPFASQAIAQLEGDRKPALARLRNRCSVLRSDRMVVPDVKIEPREAGQIEVLSAPCILKAKLRE
jgi:hypothetical protein